MIFDILKGILILIVIFVPLERGWALHSQKTFRQGWTTDLLYFVMGHGIGKWGTAAIASFVVFLMAPSSPTNWQSLIANQPIILQLIEAVFVAELGYYFAHRMLHQVPFLWKFHAIHHSSEQLDWLATVRVHPVDQLFTKTFQLLPIYCLGFSAQVLGVYFLFSSAIAFLIHANLRWRFGPFNWLMVTPEIHHWHHHPNPHFSHRNFAAQLSLIDRIFQTFYLPSGQIPERYGICESIPQRYFSQLIYPFQALFYASKLTSKIKI